MNIFDNHENSSESSISLASSIFTQDLERLSIYGFDSDVPDDVEGDMDDDHQPYGPPTYSLLMLENATVRSDADFFSVTGWTTATVGSSAGSTSETRCPAPASVSASVSASASMADLTASTSRLDLQVQEPRPSESMTSSSPGPSSHVVGRASDISANADSLFNSNSNSNANSNSNYGYIFDQGLCGIGAWAEIATSPFVAKMKRITPRQ
ncbi:uncharacterized protein B0J16DRAFT_8663 [Fusarium flagelliforme]|uniref:Uncharacterized protein n=1 Tax=Fusarium flagelliforme TaxID=2675880 RepID=A0A395MGK7_9HYPO|nr:uncharacterized protein B0J16DRAFT_8663 [Fusarium flagelliforme]KAH7196905.1 hypothetical protein B0J16DRAFT_8663 [Fusarium flagelliforme]RFN47034.1 hypothetical protein FIE12Z_8697 [Fusarium flagelliforme]